ncbi:hypothetical protein A2U01_0096235, partial [Trifolium medium]|nr:hypothetical protein [Trifolium medium]
MTEGGGKRRFKVRRWFLRYW